MKLIHLLESPHVTNEDYRNAIKKIQADCEPFLKELTSNAPLYRGMGDGTNTEFMLSKRVRMDRKPSLTNQFITNLFDEYFGPKFGFKPRTQSIFCTGDDEEARVYGSLYLVFPKGDFKYIWSDTVRDFYTDIVLNPKLFDGRLLKPALGDFESAFIEAVESLYPIESYLDVVRREFGAKAHHVLTVDGFAEFIAAYGNGAVGQNILREYYLRLFAKDWYTDKNLSEAIASGKEIMIHCNEYYAVSLSLLHQIAIDEGIADLETEFIAELRRGV